MKKNTKDNRMLRFALPAVLLCCAALTLLLLSVQKDREYRALAQITPVPTATIRSDIRIGSAGYMSAVTSAPSPTSVPLQNVPGASTQMPALYAVPAQTPVSLGTPVPTMAAATSAPEQSGSILLRSGSSGSQVKQLQERLQALGYYSGTVDGAFGSGTKKAVQQFQSQHGLDADGIVGEKTWSMLLSDEAKTFEPTPTPYLQDILSGETPFLINKSHPVGSDFVPNDLVYIRDIIPSSVAALQSNNAQGVREAVEALKVMLEAALADGIGHWKVREAYRTYADQERGGPGDQRAPLRPGL